ncbi:MAG: sulfatase [Verrucomicrobia bacterium]|nr:sulfatase [Verrucomicrobiota bacterium]
MQKICTKLLLILTLPVVSLCLPSIARAASETSKPNVLLIIADDLNDWIGPMKGHPQVQTPHLDKLAARGMTFMNAQVSAPVCNPSRASFMSGQRPSTTGIYHNHQFVMPEIPRGVFINDYLRRFGYTSLGAGKIYHYKQYRSEDWDKVDYSTDDTLPRHPANRRPGPFGYRMFTEGKPAEPFNEQRDESELVDYKSVSWCIEQLNEPRKNDNSFFMVCGIHRPHTPWDVPKKYFDLYPLETLQLPQVLTNDLDDVPAAGLRFANRNVHAALVKGGIWKDRVRAYLASVSYADAQIGRLLDALEKSKERDNTIVIFISDHDWHLGEKEHWAKSALWRQSTRIPMIWVAPGLTRPGTRCDRAVDVTSLYPTICELTGTPVPKHAEGISIKPLLANPKAKWKQPAIVTYLQNNHAIVTEDWRYIRYADGSEELYNQKTDVNEWINVASKSEFAKVKKNLGKFLPKINAEPVAERAEPDATPGRPARNKGKASVSGKKDPPPEGDL